MSITTLLIRLSIFLIILLLIDLYAFQAIRTVFRESSAMRIIYWTFAIFIYGFILYGFLNFDRSSGPNAMFQMMMGMLLLSLLPKLIVLIMMLGEDLFRLIWGSIRKISGTDSPQFLPDRRVFISQTALILAAIPFLGILHGMWRGRYNYRVIRKVLTFKDLPPAFDGFTLTQISDIHSGSFTDKEKIQYGVDMINAQKSDIIVFTGDLVNNRADEMLPWLEVFSRLQAPMGKFSILGNHDYGDYTDWPSGEAKKANMELLYEVHQKLGFRLLRNENVNLQKEGEEISLLGVENWGKGFVQHGDLSRAAQGVKDENFKILLSHDPSHFDEVVTKFGQFIHLTLSGHTHGMQFGIEIPGLIKWSPVKYRYPRWAGLYESLGRYLYVNRGFGFLAFPGRVGIWPEITVLELRRSEGNIS